MPRLRVIVLDQVDARSFQFVMWADVPVSRQVFYVRSAGTVSVWKDALAPDNANLVSGAVTEEVRTFQVPSGTPLGQARIAMENLWTQFQDRVTNQNPWARYGATLDGTTWIAGGVA